MKSFLTRLLLLTAWGATLCLSSHFSFPRQLLDKEEKNQCPSQCTCDKENGKNAYCSGKGMTDFPAGISEKAQTLIMDTNEIEVLNSEMLSNLKQLRYLSLKRNKIKTVSGRIDGQLRELYLDYNLIQTIDLSVFSSLKHLTHLSLKENKIHTVSCTSSGEKNILNSLGNLYLDNNLIETIDLSVFSPLKHLTHLSLKENRIHTVSFSSPGDNNNLDRLEYLYLEGNNISSINISIFSDMKKLIQVTLKNKGQACSCDFEVHRSGNTNYQLKGLSCGLESSLPIEDLNCSVTTLVTAAATKPSTAAPTKPPTDAPTKPNTDAPTKSRSDSPSKPLTGAPTKQATDAPTKPPTDASTQSSTDSPSTSPTDLPTEPPTDSPTKSPTDPPTTPTTDAPTKPVTDSPTKSPTDPPTTPTTDVPTKPVTDSTIKPSTDAQTKPPTDEPATLATDAPTKPPTDARTKPHPDSPTTPATEASTQSPTDSPSNSPTDSATNSPTDPPTTLTTDAPIKPSTDSPTKPPIDEPSTRATDAPTKPPTDASTQSPTDSPSESQTDSPTKPPTDSPTKSPTDPPTTPSTDAPVKPVTDSPIKPSTGEPTTLATDARTKPPTDAPSKPHTDSPTNPATDSPTNPATDAPTKPPTDAPTNANTASPTKLPTDTPTKPPTDTPTKPSTDTPTKPPTGAPTKPRTDSTAKQQSDAPTNSMTGSPTKLITDTPTKPHTAASSASPSVANTDSVATRTASVPLETIASSPSEGSTGPPTSGATPEVTEEGGSSESDEPISCYVCRNETDTERCQETDQCQGKKRACMSSIQLNKGGIHYTMECAVRSECHNQCTCTGGTCSICCKDELCNSDKDVSSCVCQSELKDGLTWPITLQGSTAELPCRGQSTGKVTRQCLSTWRDPNFSECQMTSEVTGGLEDLLNQNKSENKMAVSRGIMALTERSSEFSEHDVEMAVRIVTELLILSIDARQRGVIKNTLSAMSNMFNVPKKSLVGAERKYQSAKGYLKAIDDFTGHVEVKDSPIEEVNSNLAIFVKQINQANFKNITLEADKQMLGKESVVLRDSLFTVRDGVELKDSVSLPATLFSNVVEDGSKPDGDRASFVLHEEDTFFKAIQDAQEQSETVGDGSETPDLENITMVNSRVLSVSIGNLTLVDLRDPVVITFTHRLQNSSKPQCVFWDTLNGAWSSRGCRVRESVNGSHTVCQCNHLTNFALLMDVYDSGTTASAQHADILTLLSFIGCGISFFGLVLTIVIYCLFSKLRKGTPSKILLNLCLALACVNVTFIIGIYALDNPPLCKAIAILMHYFLLSSMAWMSIEAFYMYLALVLVFRTYFRRFLLKTMLFGWGVPLVIVAITVGVNPTENYGSLANNKLCWLSRIPFYVSFLAPVVIVLIGNSIIFAMVIRQICGMSSKKLNKSETVSLSQQFRGVAGVFILLGLSWIFAIFAIDDARLAFQYLFTIFNSLQGLFIFIFYCLMKRDIQKKLFCCESHSFPSSSSQKSSRGTQSTSQDTKRRFRAAVNAVMSVRLVSKRGSKETIQERLEDINPTPLGPLEVTPNFMESKENSPPPYDSLNMGVLY